MAGCGETASGDRFFDYAPDYQGKITFIALEMIKAMAHEPNLAAVRQRKRFSRTVAASGQPAASK